jgi:hypothetical protein
MKLAIVLGFFDPVYARLRQEYAGRLDDRSIIWVGVQKPHGDGNLRQFKETIFDRLARGAKEITVLAVVKRGREEFKSKIEEIRKHALSRHPDAAISIKTKSYALDEDWVLGHIASCFDSAEQADFPDTLADLPLWCEENLAGVTLHPRAVDGAKKSSYEDVPLIYKCLRTLDKEYRDSRIGGGSKCFMKLKAKLGQLGACPRIPQGRGNRANGTGT